MLNPPDSVQVVVPNDAAVECWAVASDGRRLGSSTGGTLEVPQGAVLEVRGRRRARAKLSWLTEVNVPVVSVDVRRSVLTPFELMAAASLPHLAVFTAAGDAVDVYVLEAIARAGNLAVLQLEAPALRAGDLRPLWSATRLRQVRLDVPNLPVSEVVDVLGDRKLTAFGLTAPRVTQHAFDQIVSRWPLRELSVALERVDRATLRLAGRLSCLAHLALDGLRVSLGEFDVTALVARLPELRSLDLTEDGAQLSPDLLVGGYWLRPGIRVNGLAMDEQATARFIGRWRRPR
ncbi:MAG: hypothetical protein J2P24_13215 [Streptosporangiales bacterium]|nr:hypothetical protein [Streptosporangiales bacterium]MBO0890071.1 hypothetical protein [Acidothermales bacterium]